MKLSITPTTYSYKTIHQMLADYRAGRPVMVHGYGPLSGLTVDCYEEYTLKKLGYTHIEFRYHDQSLEVVL
jgi:hypothetical protein